MDAWRERLFDISWIDLDSRICIEVSPKLQNRNVNARQPIDEMIRFAR